MLLLFVGGIMNLLWIAVLALYVLLEKVLPVGASMGRGMGVLMILTGVVVAWVGL
jgi:predicted metal-binding membrane protein